MERWEGKVAVVTGASGGIGAAICEKFAISGLIVIGLARRLDKMERLCAKISDLEIKGKFIPVQCDVTAVELLPELFSGIQKDYGGIDVLVNNAGVLRSEYPIHESPLENFKAILDTNVLAMATCCREAIRSMKERKVSGHVFNINSVKGHKIVTVPGSHFNLYAASKHAVTAMTETLKYEMTDLEPLIKITSVSPSVVKTDIFSTGKFGGMDAETLDMLPHLTPEEVADSIAYVLSTPPHVLIYEMKISNVKDKF